MGAAREQHQPARRFKGCRLFMAEIIRQELPVAFAVQRGAFPDSFQAGRGMGQQKKTGSELQHPLDKHKALPKARQNVLRHADVPRFTSAIEGQRGFAPQIDARLRVTSEKCFQPARMVIVAMGEHGRVYGGKVQAERLRVPGEKPALAGVQQIALATVLHVQAQAVLAGEALAGAVFR